MTKPLGGLKPGAISTSFLFVTKVTFSSPVIVSGSQAGSKMPGEGELRNSLILQRDGVASGLTVRPGGRSLRSVLIVRKLIGSSISANRLPAGKGGEGNGANGLCLMMYWVKPIGGWPAAVV